MQLYLSQSNFLYLTMPFKSIDTLSGEWYLFTSWNNRGWLHMPALWVVTLLSKAFDTLSGELYLFIGWKNRAWLYVPALWLSFQKHWYIIRRIIFVYWLKKQGLIVCASLVTLLASQLDSSSPPSTFSTDTIARCISLKFRHSNVDMCKNVKIGDKSDLPPQSGQVASSRK